MNIKTTDKYLAIEKIIKNINYAKVRCMDQKELIKELLLEPISVFNDKPDIIDRLNEISHELEEESIQTIANLIDFVIKESENIPSKYKYKTDSYLKRLLKILPDQVASKYAFESIKHKRKNRRKTGFDYLKHYEYRKEDIEELLLIYRTTNEQIILEHIARNYYVGLLSDDELDYILGRINEDYWKCRIIGELIEKRDIDNFMKSIFRKHKYATYYAMGRKENGDVLKYIESYIDDFLEDYDALGLIIWSLGKVKAKKQLLKIEQHIITWQK